MCSRPKKGRWAPRLHSSWHTLTFFTHPVDMTGTLYIVLAFLSSVHLCPFSVPSVLWRCWLGGRKGIRPVKKLSGGVPSVWSEVQTCIWPSWYHCHSLSLASVKSRLVFTFLVPAYPGSPRKRAVKRVCVCVCPSVHAWVHTYVRLCSGRGILRLELICFLYSKREPLVLLEPVFTGCELLCHPTSSGKTFLTR